MLISMICAFSIINRTAFSLQTNVNFVDYNKTAVCTRATISTESQINDDTEENVRGQINQNNSF